MRYSAKFNCTKYFGVVMRLPLSSKLFQTHETYIYTQFWCRDEGKRTSTSLNSNSKD